MRAGLVALFLTGCFTPSSVECSDRVCPQFTVCEERIHDCVVPDQITVCRDASAPNSACESGAGPGFCRDIDGDGTCADCVCLPARCGDGFVDGAEQCDGAALGAKQDCTDFAFYDSEPIGCTGACTYDTSACSRTCGDKIVDTDHGEVCDDTTPPAGTCIAFGFDAGAIACLPGGCSPDFATCTAFDWSPSLRDSAHLGSISSAGGHVFAAGTTTLGTGIVVELDGFRWSTHDSGLPYDFTGIWAASATEFWVLGSDIATDDRHVVHYASGTWTDMLMGGPAMAIWGSAPDDVWLFGFPSAMHWDGTAWSDAATGTPPQGRFAWGSGAHDLWVSGYAGNMFALFHYDGAWQQVTAFPSTSPGVGWSFAPDDVYVGCDAGVMHWNGATWALSTPRRPSSMWGAGPGDVYAVVTNPDLISGDTLHFDGARWATISSKILPRAIGGSGSTVIAVRPTDPVVYRYGGAAWFDDHHYDGEWEIRSLWSRGPDEVFSVLAQPVTFAGAVAHFANGASMPPTGSNVFAVGGAGADVYAVGSSSVARWTGATFGAETAPAGNYFGVAGPSAQRVFAVGSRIITRDGTGAWSACAVAPGGDLADVWCDGSTCVAVGIGGIAYRWSGGDPCGWVAETLPNQSPMSSVWGSSATDVWIVGLNGVVMHYDGAWSIVPIVGLGGNLQSIRGSSATDVFLATSGGAIWHFDGMWSELRNPTPALRGRLAVSSTSVWYGGGSSDATGNTALLETLERTTW